MSNKRYDIAIVGAGVVGCAIARELARYDHQVVVLERESDVGMGQSGSNSAIIHSGHDPAPGSAKAALNVAGNRMWPDVCSELDIPFSPTGALIVATTADEESRLEPLMENGRANGVEGLEIVGTQQVLERAPAIAGGVRAALITPTAGVIDAFQAVLGLAENAAAAGVEFRFNESVTALETDGDGVAIHSSGGTIRARWCINVAGVHSDEIMHMAGSHPEFEITARRGEYFVFDGAWQPTDTVLFPMPGPAGKGILVTPTTHGNVMVGPNAEEIPEKDDTAVSRAGLSSVLEGAKRLVPTLDPRRVIATFAGVRSTGNYMPDGKRDFLIERDSVAPWLINVAGIESPGFTSAPAVATHVVDILREAGEQLRTRDDFNPTRRRPPRFRNLSHAERAELVAQNPAYGRIVCRCEQVTEGEVLAAIHAPIPARTYDAIKRRTWLGTGRCQGSFDYPRTLEILARETGHSMTEISKRGPGSVFLYARTKEAVVDETGGLDG